MKKFLSYILISLVIGANLLAPISVGWGKNNLEVKSNKAEANWILNGAGDNPITITTDFASNDTSIKISVDVFWPEIGYFTSESIHVLKLSDTQTDPLKTIYDEDKKIPLTSSSVAGHQVGNVEFTGLTPLKTYKFTVRATQNSTSFIQSSINTLNTIVYTLIPISSSDQYLLKNTGEVQNPTPYDIQTLSQGVTTFTPQVVANPTIANNAALLPDCAADFWNTIGGCFGQLLYWGIFQPTSFIFGLTGKLLDLSVDYSIKDTSYRSSFVVEGWGVVRDFCNMFFIFVLLYIAFKTILGLGASKTKEMVINVVIIGLLINFSLFATQVIIDASNILTRVFYNSQSIAIGPKINGVIQDQRGSNGEIKLSEALVAKINPQKLILQASKADNIQTKQTIPDSLKQTNGISATTFILVTILASVVNIVGLITFLMCSLIFISRVIGLWMAMIFAPLAFFSYTIPALQDTEMIGWKKWWPETLKMAFLAPVFIFFMYLIIKFLDTGLGLVINDSASGMDFILGIFIPFIFIMILLTKAKDVAKKMSGTIGEKITNAAKTVGGVALGAGLGAGAMAMRGTVGRLAENMSEKQGFKDWAAKSRFGGSMLKATRGVASGSFDARGVKVFGKDLSSTGLKVGKSGGVGGFTKGRKDWTENQEKFASSLNMNEKERYDRGLTFTGAPGEDRTAIQAQIDAINTERRLNRAETVDGATTSRNIASTKIREASINRNKKLQDALIAAAGGGTPATPPTPPTPPHP